MHSLQQQASLLAQLYYLCRKLLVEVKEAKYLGMHPQVYKYLRYYSNEQTTPYPYFVIKRMSASAISQENVYMWLRYSTVDEKSLPTRQHR